LTAKIRWLIKLIQLITVLLFPFSLYNCSRFYCSRIPIFTVFLIPVYKQAEVELDNLESNWGEQYPLVIKSWRDNWHKLSAYFQYTDAIRRLIYTTNTVEGYHRQIRKVTKNKGVFTNDTALEKLVYLAYRNIRKKWTMPLKDWGQAAQQLAILFLERFKLFD